MHDVESVLDELGIQIEGANRSRKTGQINYKARCPHHYKGNEVDHDPSWYINAVTGKHFCQSCRFGGDLEWLLHIVTGRPLSEFDQLRGQRALERVRAKDPWDGERPVQIQPVTGAHIKMHGRPPQWAMDKRYLTTEMVEAYDIRWSDHFMFDGDTYDNCWIVPILHPDGNQVMGMQVKQEGGRFFRNLPGSVPKSITVFGVQMLAPDLKARVVESPLDAPLACSPGVVGISSYGVLLTAAQLDLVSERTSGLVLALDNDKSGREMTRELLGLWPSGKPCRYATDYSQRMPIRVHTYDGIEAKDLGDMTPEVRAGFLNNAQHALTYKMSLLKCS